MSFDVIVMAAGRGTRMRSRTPKVLHPVCGRPIVLWPVLAAQDAGARRVVVVGGPDRALADHLPAGIELAVQPLADGTAGAVAAGLEPLEADLPVVVLSGDVPLVTAEAIVDLVATRSRAGAAAAMATTVLADPSGYGRVVRGADGGVLRVAETKADGDATDAERAIDEVNTGIFCFDGPALAAALTRVGTNNAQGERYLPDVLEVLRADGGQVVAHPVTDPGLVLGINDRTQLAAVQAEAQRRIVRGHELAGVTFVAPGATVVEAEVELGADTVVEPGCVLRGATRVGEGCRVGPHTTLLDTVLGDDVVVRHAFCDGALAQDGVRVGPFAYLRPGTVLRTDSRVGTFVELKNSDLGVGAKVPHLSYIGDADIGEGTNLGASTITANYDGVRKHRTRIGARVRSSVHVSFVAPVSVGDDAYTGAGSTITKDVPPGALGIARARQTSIAGYAERRRAALEARDG